LTIDISNYEKTAKITDQFSESEVQPILLGLYGEVGGAMSAVKKFKREQTAFLGYKQAVVDELGDTFWYFNALVRRAELSLTDLLNEAMSELQQGATLSATNDPKRPISVVRPIEVAECDFGAALLVLGKATTDLFDLERDTLLPSKDKLLKFLRGYFDVLVSSDVSFEEVLQQNAKKIIDRHVLPDVKELPDFDAQFDEDEQLPRRFEIEIKERENGKVYMRMNGVFIGAPLTDNIREPDGFRFHDVIHFAHAAILHWSPTIRGLLKHKRKSNAAFDEGEDGGRSIVVEEGLAAWVFSKAKELEYFDGHLKISIDMLKTIQDFVKGYEVSACPTALWEKAILEGYAVFREVMKHNGGIIVGNRDLRTIEYRPLETKND